MPEGNAIVYLGILLGMAGIVTSYLRLRTRDERLLGWSRMITVGLFLLVTGATLFLYYLFISADVGYQYVWQYTSTDASLKYRVSGTIAGMAGSLLFWVWMMMIPWLVIELRAMRKGTEPDLMDWTRIVFLGTVVVFLYNLSLHEIFAPTGAGELRAAPDGLGLNLLLQTDLMAIHPPVVFVAYGFLVIPFATAFGHLLTGRREWTDISLLWSRLGWLFLTAGIGIGGLWAYVVLGWGGYWGWDPVETSSLLPWLLLTGFLHAQLMNVRKGDYPILAPVLGIFSFILVVFATFATRAGGLWISVHTFGSADQDITVWDRFKEVWENAPSVRIYLLFMVLAILATVWLAQRMRSRRPRPKEDRYFTLAELIDDEMLMFGTIVVFVVTTLITFLILMGGTQGRLTADNFNTPVGLLALIGMLLLMVCLVWRDLGKRLVAQIAGVTLLVAVVGLLLFSDNPAVAASTPILAVALIGVVYKVVKSFNRRRVLPSLRLVSAHLIHLSVILILVGYVGSNFLQEERSVDIALDGPSSDYAGYGFKASNLEGDADHAYVDIEVSRDGGVVGKERPGFIRIIDPLGYEQQRSDIQVVSTLWEDVYMTFNGTYTEGSERFIHMDIKTLPLMSALWSGMYLMMIGIAVRVGVEAVLRRGRPRTGPGTTTTGLLGALADEAAEEEEGEGEEEEEEEEVEEGEEEEVEEGEEEEAEEGDEEGVEEVEKEAEGEKKPPSRDDSYYEALLEEELKRI